MHQQGLLGFFGASGGSSASSPSRSAPSRSSASPCSCLGRRRARNLGDEAASHHSSSRAEAADANTIVEQLRSDGVPYELTDGGGDDPGSRGGCLQRNGLRPPRPGCPVVEQRRLLAARRHGRHHLRVPAVGHLQARARRRARRDDRGHERREDSHRSSWRSPRTPCSPPTRQDPTASVFVETQNGVTLDPIRSGDRAPHQRLDRGHEGDRCRRHRRVRHRALRRGRRRDRVVGQAGQRLRGPGAQLPCRRCSTRIVGAGNATVAVVGDDQHRVGRARRPRPSRRPRTVTPLNESRDTETYTGTGAGRQPACSDPTTSPFPAVPAATAPTTRRRPCATTRSTRSRRRARSRPEPSPGRRCPSRQRSRGQGVNIADIIALVSAAAGIDPAGATPSPSRPSASTPKQRPAAEAGPRRRRRVGRGRPHRRLIRIGIIALAMPIPVFIALMIFVRRSRQQ